MTYLLLKNKLETLINMEENFEKITFTHRENLLLTRIIEEQLKNLEKIKLEIMNIFILSNLALIR